MAYELDDFVETLAIAGIAASRISCVLLAWGEGDLGRWDGGFLVEWRDGRLGYIRASCGESGWRVTVDDPREWDDDPVELNLWLRMGGDSTWRV